MSIFHFLRKILVLKLPLSDSLRIYETYQKSIGYFHVSMKKHTEQNKKRNCKFNLNFSRNDKTFRTRKQRDCPLRVRMDPESFDQGSYASGKCQGNLNFFKVRELSGNFMLCQ